VTAWLPPRPDAIPPELRALGWVVWRAETRGEGKPTKVPYQVVQHPRRRASSTNPATWGTFNEAIAATIIPDVPVDGIGVVLTAEADITCIDLDHVIAGDGQLDHRAETIVERCDSFTEVSPSGTGLHIFVRGRVPRALKGPHIEVYSTDRYIAVTGHRWPGTPAALRWQQPYLNHLVRIDGEGRRPYNGPSVPAPDDLAGALLAKLQAWGIPAARVKRWADGYLVELVACPWANEHTTGPSGAAVMIRASGAYDFTCLHAHCGGRGWRDFRSVMEQP
jgi:hypothetical protein